MRKLADCYDLLRDAADRGQLIYEAVQPAKGGRNMKGCHFIIKKNHSGYAIEALKDDIWYRLRHNKDSETYSWEHSDGSGKFVPGNFWSPEAAKDWMRDIEQVPDHKSSYDENIVQKES